MKIISTLHRRRSGYTLIELMFSIAFLSALVLGATISFVNILGIYNRAQGLTRTQDAARDSLDTISRDLVHTTDYITTPAPSLSDGITDISDFYCLRDIEGASEKGYALLQLSDRNYHLARLQDCSSTANYQLLVPSPTWSKSTTIAGGVQNSSCTDALQIESLPNVEPKVWRVTVRVSHGDRDPCGAANENLGDTRAASTVLTTHVVKQ